MTVTEQLFALQDSAYADFQSRLVPNIPREQFIGVRIPALRKLAKELQGTEDGENFLRTLPHRYYDENILHALLLSGMKDYEACIRATEAFLPYVDNWASCDILSPKVFRRHRQELLPEIYKWARSGEPYTVRFGIEMLMVHFLDEDFRPEYLKLPAEISSTEYYVNMMRAWFFATALAKQWDASIPYLESGAMDRWTHNKTIQKGIESFRITDEQKVYLKSLRR